MLAAAAAWPEETGPSVVAEARAELATAAGSEGSAMFGWGVTALISGGYVVAVVTGSRHLGPPVLTYLAMAGLAGGMTGLSVAAWHKTRLRGLIVRLDQDLARPDPASPLLRPLTSGLVGGELHRRHRELHKASEGALRAGCVVPVLLSGIGLYGVLAEEPGGQQLAGVSLGGAMVIGVPSMLTYWGLSGRLERMDRLMRRWSDTFEVGGATTR